MTLRQRGRPLSMMLLLSLCRKRLKALSGIVPSTALVKA
jgi:hypothetical protein